MPLIQRAALVLFASIPLLGMAETPPTTDSLIAATLPGQRVELPGVDLVNIPQIDYERLILPGPQYLISDDPEYIRELNVAAFRENVEPGRVRFYLYNVNGIKEPLTDTHIVPVIANKGASTLHLRMVKFSSQQPSGNYFKIGKMGLFDYFHSEGSQEILTVEPGAFTALDERFVATVLKKDDLVHGLYEFVIDQPAEISVVQIPAGTDYKVAWPTITGVLPTKSKSGAGRGVFGVSEYEILMKEGFVLDTAEGPRQLIVADGNNDPWVRGREATITEPAMLKGNYGVFYEINVERTSTDGRGLALIMWNARADEGWCRGLDATVVVNGVVIQVPSNELNVRAFPECVVVKTFAPLPVGEKETITVRYSPPGASCLPTPLVFLPYEVK
ncbi:MAG: copper amine oxidase [Candidatus Sumerlaeia bacterium]|nr:copper amine oxidase [Candidatus Sumerlaeia bacterium]